MNRRRSRRNLLTTPFVLLAVVLGACSAGASASPGGSGNATISVVTTTTVFADLVANVGGDLVTVKSLVPANGDVHTFSPKPSDMTTLARARVVVMNGLGLDDWLTRTVESVAPNAVVVRLGVDLPGVAYAVGQDPNGPANPHLWLDVSYAERYVDRIADALKAADPPHAPTYEANRGGYQTKLAALDASVMAQIASIPAANRRFVAFHDAFPYYARRYGLEIVGVAVAAPGQDPGASYTADLITAIKAAHVKAIFSEAQFPPKLIQQLADATGATVVATLYDDSIGDAPVTSYEAVMRWDTEQFVKALS